MNLNRRPQREVVPRAERYKQVKALRDKGLLYREIGERTGLATSTVGDLLLDPSGEAARERKRRYEHPCIDCGAIVNPNGKNRGNGRCQSCHGKWEQAQSRRWILDSFREWEELFGVPPTAGDWNVAQLRDRGRWDKVTRYESTERPWPTPSLVIDIFGTWNAGREAAGFPTFEPGHYGRDGEDPQILAETVEMYRSGLSGEAVAERMGCHAQTVYERLRRAGEPRRNPAWGQNALKTHCPQGHPYDEFNTYREPAGGRQCRTCRREASREHMRRKRAA